jgi:hypothetical protein
MKRAIVAIISEVYTTYSFGKLMCIRLTWNTDKKCPIHAGIFLKQYLA